MTDLIIADTYYGGDQMPWAEYVIAGNIVFLSGAEGRDMRKKQEYPGPEDPGGAVYKGVEAQTHACLDKIVERVRKLDLKLENIAVINYYVVSRSDWPVIWQTCRAFWEEHCPHILEHPRTGTLLTQIGLDRPDMLIEIEAIAYRP